MSRAPAGQAVRWSRRSARRDAHGVVAAQKIGRTMQAAASPRVLVVGDGDESTNAIATLLGSQIAADVRSCARPDQAAAHARAHGAEVIVLALPSLMLIEREAPALRETRGTFAAPPLLIALCEQASVAAAARLCRQGVIDDYVQHYPIPLDGNRLAASVRFAARMFAAIARNAQAIDKSGRASRIVVIEDDETQQALIAAMLASEPVELVFESDGATALDRIHAAAPDLVLMDVGLPGIDGVEITGQIKASPTLASIPVVMLTGEARFETLVRSMEAGAADFIVKPFTRDALVAKLGKFLPTVI